MRRLAICLAATVAIFAACSTAALSDPPGGWLGIAWQPSAANDRWRGFGIKRAFKGSPAAEAGLVPGDIIVSVDGREYGNLKEMMDNVFAAGPEAIVKFGVVRNGVDIVVSAKLTSYDTAMTVLKREAAAGDSVAMLLVGGLFHMSRGVPLDYKEARRWYLMAAEKGETGAMINLGDMDQQGKGGKIDPDAARGWYQRAADAGNNDGADRLKYLNATRVEIAREHLKSGTISPPQATRWPPGLATALGEQIRACWKPTKQWPAVTVRFKLAQDGALSGEPEIPLHKTEAEAAETAAVGAITKCQPYRLPAGQYEAWKSVVWTFDPAIMD
jgi:hypothetical protein